MRHRVASKSFNRDTKARKALFKSLVRALIEQGSIETTLAKAKALKRISDRILSKATEDTISRRRTIHAFFGTRDVVNTIFDKIIPAAGGRISGFTRIERMANRRGDNAAMVKIMLVSPPEKVGSLRNLSENKKKTVVVKKTEKEVTKKPKTTKTVKKVAKAEK